jgi:hypothetical protein
MIYVPYIWRLYYNHVEVEIDEHSCFCLSSLIVLVAVFDDCQFQIYTWSINSVVVITVVAPNDTKECDCLLWVLLPLNCQVACFVKNTISLLMYLQPCWLLCSYWFSFFKEVLEFSAEIVFVAAMCAVAQKSNTIHSCCVE